MTVALLWLAAGAWLLAAVLGTGARKRILLRGSAAVSAIGGLASIAGGVSLALSGHGSALTGRSDTVVGYLGLRATPLAATFIVLLGLITLAIGCYIPRYHAPGAGTAVYLCVYNIAVLASLGILLASNITTFLVAWESMTLSTGLIVLRYHRKEGVAKATYLYLSLGEVGFIFIIAAFMILATQCHSLNLATIALRVGSVSLLWRSIAFVLAVLGFGFKAGLVPLHIWLPAAHPVAPADGSAFLSGLVINLGVYGIMFFGYELLGKGPVWWGILVLVIGSLTAAIGILYALMERDFKRFLAYSSIENIGIIVIATGASLTFRSSGLTNLGAFLLIVSLYHVLNHGIAKTLLFLEAGVIEHGAGTRNLDRLGGLIHRMPVCAIVTLVGTVGLAALPPLNGFVSEWLLFQGLFQGFRIHSHLVGVLVTLSAATLGLTGGMAILAFARSFGIAFLGMPRSQEAARASERGQPLVGPGILASVCVALALGAPVVLVFFNRIARFVTGVDIRSILLLGNLTIIPAHTNFSAFSPTYLAAFLVGVSIVPITIYRLARPLGRASRVPVWDGGIVDFKARMQYTATTFANPVRVTFDRLYRPDVHVERTSDDPAGSSGPVHYNITVLPIFENYLYRPIIRVLRKVARAVQPIQSGDVNLYLLYIFIVLILALLVYAL